LVASKTLLSSSTVIVLRVLGALPSSTLVLMFEDVPVENDVTSEKSSVTSSGSAPAGVVFTVILLGV